jgi:hypothetical protein
LAPRFQQLIDHRSTLNQNETIPRSSKITAGRGDLADVHRGRFQRYTGGRWQLGIRAIIEKFLAGALVLAENPTHSRPSQVSAAVPHVFTLVTAIARRQARHDDRFEMGQEALAIHDSFQHKGRSDPVGAQAGDECRGLEITKWQP